MSGRRALAFALLLMLMPPPPAARADAPTEIAAWGRALLDALVEDKALQVALLLQTRSEADYWDEHGEIVLSGLLRYHPGNPPKSHEALRSLDLGRSILIREHLLKWPDGFLVVEFTFFVYAGKWHLTELRQFETLGAYFADRRG